MVALLNEIQAVLQVVIPLQRGRENDAETLGE